MRVDAKSANLLSRRFIDIFTLSSMFLGGKAEPSGAALGGPMQRSCPGFLRSAAGIRAEARAPKPTEPL
jgi:hypothetical protein